MLDKIKFLNSVLSHDCNASGKYYIQNWTLAVECNSGWQNFGFLRVKKMFMSFSSDGRKELKPSTLLFHSEIFTLCCIRCGNLVDVQDLLWDIEGGALSSPLRKKDILLSQFLDLKVFRDKQNPQVISLSNKTRVLKIYHFKKYSSTFLWGIREESLCFCMRRGRDFVLYPSKSESSGQIKIESE